MKNFISLGAGVQSSTMALMAANGEITPMPDAAIFADTQAEPKSVYRWLDYLEKQLPFPVWRATKGNLSEDGLVLKQSKASGKMYLPAQIPAFVKNADGSKGILHRQCTRDYKVLVVRREIRKQLTAREKIVQWIGISRDEIIRMKPADVDWIENRWPLIDLSMTRNDCLDWMSHHGYPKPPRSACSFCPYHSDREWLRLKTEEPEAFASAVKWEQRYREVAKLSVIEGTPFLHASLIPLDQVNFNANKDQLNFFANECEGMCGV